MLAKPVYGLTADRRFDLVWCADLLHLAPRENFTPPVYGRAPLLVAPAT
jgi:hypothetical protein